MGTTLSVHKWLPLPAGAVVGEVIVTVTVGEEVATIVAVTSGTDVAVFVGTGVLDGRVATGVGWTVGTKVAVVVGVGISGFVASFVAVLTVASRLKTPASL